MPFKAGRILGKFIRRAFWMNYPLSLEFRMFFMEMITEIRNLSGRDFNADITLSDLKRTIISITEKYPSLKKISLNTVFKTMNTMDSLSRAGDLFSIASAVSASWLSVGTLFIGPLPYILLKVFAPGRLKCGVIMGVGGLIGLELYNIKQAPAAEEKRCLSVFTILSGLLVPVIFFISIFAPGGLILLKIAGIILSFLFLFIFLAGLRSGLFAAAAAEKLSLHSANGDFLFKPAAENSIFSQFRLDKEEARFLFSLYYALSEESVETTPDHKIKANKRIWIDKWKSDVENEISGSLVTSPDIMKRAISGPMQGLSKFKITLILMECSLFKPFFPLKDLSDIAIPLKESVIPLKRFNGLALEMGVAASPEIFRKAYQTAIGCLNSLNIISQVIRSIASPSMYSIVPFAAIQNDTGIIKTSTIINLSGTGSPADFIIGGGVILENEMLPLLCGIAETSSYAILTQAARLETACKTIISELPDYAAILEEMISKETSLRNAFVKAFNEKVSDREELKASIHFLEMGIKRLRETLKHP